MIYMDVLHQWTVKDIFSKNKASGGHFSEVSQEFSLGEDGAEDWVLTWKGGPDSPDDDGEDKIHLEITLNSQIGWNRWNQQNNVIDKELLDLRVENTDYGSVIQGSPGSTVKSANGYITEYAWNDILQFVKDEYFDAKEFLRGSVIISLVLKKETATASIANTEATGYIGAKGINKEKLCGMIAKLENDEKNSDVKIISADGQEFYAYRWILSEVSDVFEAMFRSDMAEKETGVVKFEDLSGATVKHLLHFIYTQNIGQGQEWSTPGIVEEFVLAADKYQIEDLKKFLDANLGKVCTAENAGNLFILAKKTSMKKAVADILAFIKEQCNDPDGFFELLKNTKIN